jgi:hypothetical protein
MGAQSSRTRLHVQLILLPSGMMRKTPTGYATCPDRIRTCCNLIRKATDGEAMHYEEDMANYKKIIVWTRWGLVAALVTLGILMVMR